MGPSLVSEKARKLTNLDISEQIRMGRREFGMPPFGRSFKPGEISRLIAYVRVLQGLEGLEEVGIETPMEAQQEIRSKAQRESIARGRALFEGRGRCFDCHSIFDDGGRVAPDLTRIAKRMTREQIRESIVNPSHAIARGFEAREILTKDGRTIRGWSRSATQDAVQLFDPDEQLWTTYFIQELQSVRISPESTMPSGPFDRLKKSEQEDLMAFLVSLN